VCFTGLLLEFKLINCSISFQTQHRIARPPKKGIISDII